MNEKIAAETAVVAVPAQASGLPPDFYEMVDDLKSIVRGAHVRAQLKVNTEMIRMYWEIGRTILAKQGEERWGTKVIDRIATELRTEFPGQRGFSRTNLKYMQQFARTLPEQIGQQVAGQLPWGHIQVLLDKCKTRAELDFYAAHAVRNGWSRDQLTTHIRSGLHQAHGAAAHNFDATIPLDSEATKQILKDPYRFEFTQLAGTPSERELEDALEDRMTRFLTELGCGFAFVGRQYPLRVGQSDFRVDLLFYHFKLHCFVVVELKTTKAQPAHLGQLSFYTAAVDKFVRDPEVDGPTLGILIAESKDDTVVEFGLPLQNQPLAVSTYAALPAEVQRVMPSPEELSRVANEVLHRGSREITQE
ncbi:YhcG family protein [Streptomyces sp. NPDC091272]|uniref:PDDEXK nuclease domain-containing protein n=1 Tax=Streptomyces sp. NPDC091272 TaxID=3365981 RepID=UPI0037F40A0C